MKIGDITLPNNLILAPMAGFSDVCLRRLCAENGAGLTVTEMVSVKALLFGSKKTLELLKTHPAEKVKCVQLFGSEPEDFFRCAHLPELEKFDIIDVNMGCPAPKVFKEFSGSALMGDIKKAAEIVKALKNAGKTVSVKTRLGIAKKDEIFAFAFFLKEAGADMLAVHGRTREQMFSGTPDFSFVSELKKVLNIPIVASGGNTDPESYSLALESGADGVMIGRGALVDPSIFLRLSRRGGNKNLRETLTLKLMDYMEEEYGKEESAVLLRKYLSYILRGIHGGKDLRIRMNFCKNIDELKEEYRKLVF